MYARVPTLPTPTTLRAKSTKPVPVEQGPALRFEACLGTRRGPRAAGPRRRRSAAPSSMRSRSGTMSGGSATILGRPSTTSRRTCSSAPRLSLVCALASERASVLRRARSSTRCELSPAPRRRRRGRTRRRGRASRRTRASPGGTRRPSRATIARRSFVGEAVVPAGDLQARREALDVPLPGPRQGLVEVVDVEDEATLRGGEHAEVRQVGVPAGLHRDTRLRGVSRGRWPSISAAPRKKVKGETAIRP